MWLVVAFVSEDSLVDDLVYISGNVSSTAIQDRLTETDRTDSVADSTGSRVCQMLLWRDVIVQVILCYVDEPPEAALRAMGWVIVEFRPESVSPP